MKDISILEKSGVNVAQSLELLGDIEMYDETLNDFLTENESRIKKINDYKELGDMNNYAILAHSIKSDSKYLGFTKLAELALNHEIKSKENNFDYVNDNYDELISEVNRITNVIKEYLN